MKLKALKDFNAWIGYSGFEIRYSRSKQLLDHVMNSKMQLAQAVDATKICCSTQIEIAVMRTYRAFKMGRNIAKNMSMELLLRLSGKRQIHEALNLLGLKESSKYVALICADSDQGSLEDFIRKTLSEFAIREDETLIEVYDKSKEEVLKLTYDLKTQDIIKEVLMKIAYLEILS
ncbi:MAG TPA: KEOPS complex subunit Cgi121 [Geobacterales bacterium]|nr:KEOPS complex subunit Cgi121 [Geobacterales bacterium]